MLRRTTSDGAQSKANEGLPRSVEVAAALIGLVGVSPLLVAAAIAIRVSSAGPVLFRQIRVGLRGRHFELLKFRTMYAGAGGLGVTARDDARITPIGHLLRRTKLDELPELWNVLRGDMALVGPRPEVPRYVDAEDPLWRSVLRVRPGLTDPVAVQLRDEEEVVAQLENDREGFYLRALLPYKLFLSAAYTRERTAWSDLGILVKTMLAIIHFGRKPPPTPGEIERRLAEYRAAGGQSG